MIAPATILPAEVILPVALIFPLFDKVIALVVPNALLPLLIFTPPEKRNVAAPSFKSTMSPSSDNTIPCPTKPAVFTAKLLLTIAPFPVAVNVLVPPTF